MSDSKSYRSILKATSIFGGVQVIQILASVFRAKIVAVILGPLGMGISGLLTSALATISSFSNLGFNFSGIRDISIAFDANDNDELYKKIWILKKWILYLAIFGSVLTIILSSFLSQITFGNSARTLSFALLSIALFFTAISAGNLAILQGMRRIREVALSNVLSAILGLVVSVPLFYYLRIDGIVPALITTSIIAFLVSSFFSRKIGIVDVKPDTKVAFRSGFDTMKLGLAMMISSLLGMVATYAINAFISHRNGIIDVGLYQAGISVTNQYVGLVFVAMSVDYFPRLSAISHDFLKIRELVNQQAEIVVLIIAPLLSALIISAPIIVRLLLSPEFSSIVDFVRWVSLGLLFKGASFALGYISFAKGDKRTFFLLEGIGSNALTLLANIIGYVYGGVTGMGISFLIIYVIYFGVILIVSFTRYRFALSIRFVKVLIITFLITLASFLATIISSSLISIVLGVFLLSLSVAYSFRELDRRIEMKKLIISKMSRVFSKKGSFKS